MSIELHVEDYCQNCPEFKPECNSTCLDWSTGNMEHCHYVRCVHADKCRVIHDFIYEKIRPRGHWAVSYDPTTNETICTCSNCGDKMTFSGQITGRIFKGWPECIKCGAKLEEDKYEQRT